MDRFIKFYKRDIFLFLLIFISLAFSYSQTTWTGDNFTNDWGTAANWDSGVPTNAVNAIVPNGIGGGRVYPVINTPGAQCRNLTVQAGASLNVGTATEGLTINGRLSLNATGVLNGTGGNIAVNDAFTVGSTISDNISLAGGTITFSGDLSLGAASNITASTATFNGTVTGGTNSLTVTGNAVFGDGPTDTVTGVSTLSVTGTTTINTTTITSSSTQTYSNTVTLGEDATLNSGTGLIILAAVTSGAGESLILQGSGGAAIASANLGAGTFNVSGETGGTVTVSGALNAATLTTAATAVNIALNGGGTITNAVNFTNSGTVTLGNDNLDSITFNGGVDTDGNPSGTNVAGSIITSNDTIALGAITLTDTTTLDSGGGAITITSITGPQNLLLAAGVGIGTTTVSGAVTNLGSGTGAALDVNNGVTGLVRFQSTFGGNSGLTAGAATNVRFDDNVTLGNGNTATNLAGAVQLDGLTFSGFDGLTFNALTLSTAAVTLDSNGSAINITTLTGPQNLLLAAGVGVGTTTVSGAVTNLGSGTGAALDVNNGVTGLVRFQSTFGGNSGLTAGAATSVRFDDNVTLGNGNTATNLAGAVQLDGLTFSGFDGLTFGATTLSTAAVNLTTSDGTNITTGAITGGSQDLTVNAGATGDIVLDSMTAVGTFTVSNSNSTTVTNATAATTITLTDTTGDITFSGSVTAGTINTTALETYNVIFNGGGTITNAVNFTNSGTVTLGNDNLDSITFNGGVDTDGNPSGTNVAGSIITSNDTIALGAITLTDTTTLDSGGGAITITSITGPHNLLLAAGIAGGTTTVSGAVTNLGSGTGSALDVNNGATGLVHFQSTFGGNSGLTAGAATSVRFDDNVTLGNGNTATNLAGAVQLDGLTFSGFDGLTFGALTLSTAAVTLDSNGGNIAVTTITGPQNLLLAAGVGVGTTTVSGAVTNLGSGTGAALDVNNGVTGLVRFQSTFGGNSGLTAGAATSVRFDDNVTLGNGNTATNLAGAVQLDGLTFSGFDGLTFNALTLSTAAVTLDSNGGNIAVTTITGPQNLLLAAGVGIGTTTVSGAVTNLGSGTGAALDVNNGVTGLVRFQSTFGGNSGLTAGAATNVRFDDNVTLGNGNTATNLAGAVQLDGLTFSGFDGLTFNALTLSTAAVTLDSNGSAINITTLTGPQNLLLAAGVGVGTTTVSGAVTNLGSGTGAALDVNNGVTGLVRFQSTFGGNSGLTAGAATSVRFDDNVTLGNGNTATNLAGAVQLDGLTFSGFDGLTFGATTLSTAAVNLTTSDGTNITTGAITGGSQDLTVNAGATGDIVLDSMTAVGTFTVSNSNSTTVTNATAATTITLTDTTGDITFSGSVTAGTINTTALETYNVIFNGGGTITNAVNFTNSGTVTLGNDNLDSITFNGGVDTDGNPSGTNVAGSIITSNDTIALGAITLTDTTTLDSGGGAITITSITGPHNLLLAAGIAGGTTTVSGAVTNLGSGTGSALDVNNGATGLVHFQSTFGGNSGLTAGAATSVRFDDNVTLGNGNTATNLAGAVQLDGLTFSGFDGLTFGALTLSTAAVTLDSNGGNIAVTTITGPQNLLLAAGVGVGTTTVSGAVTNLGSGTGAALDVNNGVTGLVRFQSTFGGNSGLTAGAATSVRFDDNVTLANGNTATNLAGAVQLDGLTFSGFDGLTFGATTLSTATVNLDSNGSAINITTLTGPQNLLLAAGVGIGTTTVSGAVTNLGSGTGAALDVNNGVTGLVRFQSTFGGNSGLTAGAATNVRFDDNVTLGNGNTATNLAGAVQLDGLTFSGFDGLTFNALTLSTAAVTLDSNGSAINITTLTGPQNLLLAAGVGVGTTTVSGAVTNLGSGTGAALDVNNGVTGLVRFQSTFGGNSGLTAGAATSVRFDDNVTLGNGNTATNLAGAVQLDGLTFSGFDGLTFGATTLSTAAVNLTTSDGTNITTGGITGGSQDLTVNAGATGDIVLDSMTAVGTFTVSNSNSTTVTNATAATTITLTDTTGDITFSGSVTAGTINTTALETYNVIFNGGGTITNAVNFTNSGTVTLGNDNLDSITFNGGVDTDGNPSGTNVAGSIITSNDTIALGAITLTDTTTLDSGGGAITITSITGPHNLLLAAGIAGGTTTVSGGVTNLGSGTGSALDVNNGATGLVHFQSTFGGNSGLTAGAATSVRFDDNVTLGNGNTATNLAGAVQLDGLTFSGFDGLTFGALTLSTAAVTLDSNGGNIAVTTITGPQNLLLVAGVGVGTTTVSGAVTNLGSGTGAALDVNNGVTGLVRFQSTFGGNSGLTAGAATSVRFDDNVTLGNGNTATNLAGAVQLDGLTFSGFDGLTFGATTLSTATVNLDSNGSAINITTLTGPQNLLLAAGVGIGTTTVSGAVTNLGSGTGAVLDVNNGVTGLVRFQSTFGGNSGLTAGAATNVRFDDNVTLGNGNTATNLAGAVQLDGLTFSGFDGLTFGATTLSTAAVTLDSNGSAINITTLTGPQNLLLAAGVGVGTTTVSGAVTNLGSGTGAALDVNNGVTGLVRFQSTFGGNSGLTAGAATSVRFDDNVTLGNGNTATNLAGAVQLDGLTFSGFDGLTFGATTLSTAAVNLTTSDGTNITTGAITGGSQDLTVNAGATGDIVLDSMTAVGTFTVSNSNSTTVTNATAATTITLTDTTGDITFSGSVTAGTINTTALETYNVIFNGGGTITNAVNFTNSGYGNSRK